jgi:hypothetical protein
MRQSGKYGVCIGSLFGAIPQCGFSAAVANLYTGRVVTIGTLVATFISTSDEMLPILVSENVAIGSILTIIVYKIAAGMAVGFALDAFMRKFGKHEEMDIDAICESDNCHCENGIVRSALHHTLTVSLFVLLVTALINSAAFFIGEEALSGSVLSIPVLGHVICTIIGLIPNCAASVALTRLALAGAISTGAMLSGLLAGAGVGLLILFRMNKHARENAIITVILAVAGVLFGILADIIGISLV